MANGFNPDGSAATSGQQSWAQSQLDSLGSGTGTTGTTSDSSVSPLTNAVSNIASGGGIPTTTWNDGSGNTFKTSVDYNGHSIAPIGDLAMKIGFNYRTDPSTGAIILSNGKTINPVSNGANGPSVQVRQLLNAFGVQDQNIVYDPKTGNVSYTAPNIPDQGGGGAAPGMMPYMTQQMPFMNVLGQLGPQPQMRPITPFQAPDLSMYYNNLMPFQSQFTPDWNTFYQQAHAQFDPTTMQSMNQLMGKMNQDITSSDEKMNQRGIFNSGLAQANEDMIRGNSSNAIAKVLATSQSNIARVAQQLYKDAQTAWYQGNDLALRNNQLMLNQALEQEKQAYTQWLGGQNLNLNQYKAALSAWNDAATQGLKQAQMNMDAFKFNNLSADQSANLAQKQFEFNNLSADQQANLSQKQFEFNNLSADQKAQLAWKQYAFNNLSADQSATLAQKQMEFNNLSAQQKADLAWKQYAFSNLSANQQAQNQIQQDSLKLRLQDMMGYLKDPNTGQMVPTLNMQKFNDTVQYQKDQLELAKQRVKDSQAKADLQSMTDQLNAAKAGIDAINNNTNLQSQLSDPNSAASQNLKNFMNMQMDIAVRLDRINQGLGGTNGINQFGGANGTYGPPNFP